MSENILQQIHIGQLQRQDLALSPSPPCFSRPTLSSGALLCSVLLCSVLLHSALPALLCSVLPALLYSGPQTGFFAHGPEPAHRWIPQTHPVWKAPLIETILQCHRQARISFHRQDHIFNRNVTNQIALSKESSRSSKDFAMSFEPHLFCLGSLHSQYAYWQRILTRLESSKFGPTLNLTSISSNGLDI